MRGSYEAMKNVNDMKAQMVNKLRICVANWRPWSLASYKRPIPPRRSIQITDLVRYLHFAIKHIKEKKERCSKQMDLSFWIVFLKLNDHNYTSWLFKRNYCQTVLYFH